MVYDDLPAPSPGLGNIELNDESQEVGASNFKTPPSLHFKRDRADFNSAIEQALEASHADEIDKDAVRVVTGMIARCRPNASLLSHRGLRKNASRSLYRQLRPQFQADRGRRWFFCTFLTDVGNALEYAPVLELGRLRRDVAKMMRLLDLHAIGLVEVQVARYPLAEHGRTIEAHVHAIGYTYDKKFKVRQAERRVGRSATLQTWLGAHTADFIPIRTLADLRFRCQYMLKAPLAESWLRRNACQRSGFTVVNNPAINPWGALRLAEILASLPLRNACLSYGELGKLKSAWHREVAAYMRRHPAPDAPDYVAAFERIWAQPPVRRARLLPDIRWNAHMPLDPGWRTAMAQRIAEVQANHARYDATRAARKALRG